MEKNAYKINLDQEEGMLGELLNKGALLLPPQHSQVNTSPIAL